MKHQLLICLAMLVLLQPSCEKESEPYGEEQFPVISFAADQEYSHTVTNAGSPAEIGCEFEVLRNGRITKLCVQVPEEEVYRITLWKYNSIWVSPVVIYSISIESNYNILSCGEIVPFEVEAGDRIGVTFYTDDWAIFHDPDDHAADILPSIRGDLEIRQFRRRYDPVGLQYPNVIYTYQVWGLVDIAFEPSNE
ncbi:MAG: hypothetical protein GY751_06095 [Bacteroidetes bacterium]|nr:hypothetical protein [Bacteroidota bacterium]